MSSEATGVQWPAIRSSCSSRRAAVVFSMPCWTIRRYCRIFQHLSSYAFHSTALAITWRQINAKWRSNDNIWQTRLPRGHFISPARYCVIASEQAVPVGLQIEEVHLDVDRLGTVSRLI
eukprot:scaffold61969_cov48-Prasinocladus_malaysianus.AAC.1